MDQSAYSELNLKELRILNALLRERSITRTAQLMETTQPAISKTLKHLRQQFSDPLLVRNGQAMQPTAKAIDMTEQLRVLLDAADGLRASATAFRPHFRAGRRPRALRRGRGHVFFRDAARGDRDRHYRAF